MDQSNIIASKPLTLIVVPKTQSINNQIHLSTDDIKEKNISSIYPQNPTPEQRREYQRCRKRMNYEKYQEKTKPFLNIGHLSTVNERIKCVILLSYPDIAEYIDDEYLDNNISQFLFGLSTIVDISTMNYIKY